MFPNHQLPFRAAHVPFARVSTLMNEAMPTAMRLTLMIAKQQHCFVLVE
jgi:hypothetical protein